VLTQRFALFTLFSIPLACAALQLVICLQCRFASHKTHAFDLITNLAASERTRLQAVAKQCGKVAQTIQDRMDALHQSSKTCAQSAYAVEEEVKRNMDRIRAAVAERENQLIAQIKVLQQVLD